MLINHHKLYIEESNGKFIGARAGENVLVPDFLSEGRYFIAVESPAHTVEIDVRMEAWDCEPMPSTERWDIRGEAHMELPTGYATLRTVVSEGGPDLEVSAPDDTVRARVYCRGRDHLKRNYENFDLFEVQEWYLIQLWPLRKP
jgi:hypothetical protein